MDIIYTMIYLDMTIKTIKMLAFINSCQGNNQHNE